MRHWFLIAAAAPFLFGCATDQWTVEQRVDQLSDRKYKLARILTAARVTTGLGPVRLLNSALSIVCTDQPKPLFKFDGWPVGGNLITTVKYRFDQNPAQTPKDFTFFGVDAFELNREDARTFISELRQSNSLFIQVVSKAGWITTATFAVAGAGPMVDAAGESCSERAGGR